MSSRSWRSYSSLIVALTCACSAEEPTQLVVVIDGNLEKGTVERTDVTLSWEGTSGEEKLFCGADFPFSFGVNPLPGRPDVPVRVTARAKRNDGTLVVESSAQASFSEGHALLLQLGLTKNCIDVPCAADKTCVNGTCLDVLRTSLPIAEPSSFTTPTHQCSSGPGDAAADAAGNDASAGRDVSLDSNDGAASDVTAGDDGSREAGDGATDAGKVPSEGGDARDTRSADAGSPVDAIACGTTSTCAIAHGQVYCWGAIDKRGGVSPSSDGGFPPPQSSLVPTLVPMPFDRPASSVCAGDGYSCAIAGTDAFCWGDNSLGQLGTESDGAPRSQPMDRVRLPSAPKLIRCSADVACAIVEDGGLWCWGSYAENMLLSFGSHGPLRLGTDAWIDVAPGQGHQCAIKRLPPNDAGVFPPVGELWCWGRNNLAQLGLGTTNPPNLHYASQVGTESTWRAISSDQDGSCGIRGLNQLYCWGGDLMGRTGLNVLERNSIVLSPGHVENAWSRAATSFMHSCGILAGFGGLQCWGGNGDGQLGLDFANTIYNPTSVAVPPHDDALPLKDVSVGRFHTCIRTGADRVFCVGQNREGQLGTGDTAGRRALTEVEIP